MEGIKAGHRVEVRYQPSAPDGWDWRAATVTRVIQVGVEVTFDDPPSAHHSWAASWRNVRRLTQASDAASGEGAGLSSRTGRGV